MFLNNLLSKEMVLVVHNTLIYRFKCLNEDLSNLETRNTKLNTKIYSNLDEIDDWIFNGYSLEENEYPILECYLENGNYLLMTTERMISEYLGKKYELAYQDFFRFNPETYINRKDEESKTVIFKCYARNREDIKKIGTEFIFEIDSGCPAYFAGNQILFIMIQVGRKGEEGVDVLQIFLDSIRHHPWQL